MTTKKFTRKELAEHNSKADAVFINENLVYDVTEFLDEHPGGHEVLLLVAGKDATENYQGVGHSHASKEQIKKYLIGELVDEDNTKTEVETPAESSSFMSSWKFLAFLGIIIPVLSRTCVVKLIVE